MHIYMDLFVGILFLLLTPGVFFSLPKGIPFLYVALGHATLFAVLYHFLHKLVYKYVFEGFYANAGVAPMGDNLEDVRAMEDELREHSKERALSIQNAPPSKTPSLYDWV